MGAVVEWDVPFVLSTPAGDLTINGEDSETGGYFLLDPDQCSSSRDARVVRENVPQGSGDQMLPHFTAGYTMQLGIQLWESSGDAGKPAHGLLKNQMWDRLVRCLDSIIGDDPVVSADGRVYWTPRGMTQRMLNSVRLIELPSPQQIGTDGMVAAQFRVLSPFPYAWDAPETVTDITAGATVDNTGSARFFPVVKVHGPTSGFVLTNESVVDQDGQPLELAYDASLPGAAAIASGHYVELVFFRNTAYLDGDQDNLKSGIDVQNSDFWSLYPGENVLTVSGYSGALIEMLWQPAWA